MEKQIIHTDTFEVAMGEYPYLTDRLDLDEIDNEDERIGDLQSIFYDCDHVKLDEERGRGSEAFIDVESDDTIYIIWFYEPEQEAIELVEWWLNGAENDLIDGENLCNNWDDWDKVKKGVAYRGGSGYSYALYAKELK